MSPVSERGRLCRPSQCMRVLMRGSWHSRPHETAPTTRQLPPHLRVFTPLREPNRTTHTPRRATTSGIPTAPATEQRCELPFASPSTNPPRRSRRLARHRPSTFVFPNSFHTPSGRTFSCRVAELRNPPRMTELNSANHPINPKHKPPRGQSAGDIPPVQAARLGRRFTQRPGTPGRLGFAAYRQRGRPAA